MTTPRPWTPPLLLRIRFTTSLPDLDLDIPSPSQTTVAALKHLIRGRLAQPDSQRRLRFIHQGKILPDGSALSSVLRPLPPPPLSSASTPTTPSFPGAAAGSDDPKGKGKAKAHDAAPPRVYVNCSIGDSLTDAELAAEAEAALRAPSDHPRGGLSSSAGGAAGDPHRHGSQHQQHQAGGGQRQMPRGFDRLLNAGFTGAEVNQLRLQFREIRAAQYTPDTMPSPDTMRSLEDAWIDTNAGGALPGAAGAGGEGGDGAAAGDDAFGVMGGILDVLIEGMIVGFFWPLGCLGWLSREENMLSGRWQDFIGFGVTLSIIIGVIRAFSGDR